MQYVEFDVGMAYGFVSLLCRVFPPDTGVTLTAGWRLLVNAVFRTVPIGRSNLIYQRFRIDFSMHYDALEVLWSNYCGLDDYHNPVIFFAPVLYDSCLV
jgi:hypothetical protein